MDVTFHIQDPTHDQTVYLFEAILAAATSANHWHGIFAFASRNGVNHLVDDPVVQAMMHRGGEVDLLVGIDAVTNRNTLERLRELEQRHEGFRPRVFWNETGGLFHPKLSHFRDPDGRRTLIVGSGNLTPGGLTNNFEAYTIITADADEPVDLSSIDAFIERQQERIRPIDDDALERAARNIARSVPRAAPARPRAPAARPVPVPGFDRVLIAQVPRAGDRWAQVHFNAEVIDRFFRVTERETQRLYLTQIEAGGARSEQEVRPCVFSEANKNFKIEIGAAKGRAYPAQDPPILVFRERQIRTFDYMLLMPGEPGYAPMKTLTDTLPKVGRGHPRVISNLAQVRAAWPTSPILAEAVPDAQEI